MRRLLALGLAAAILMAAKPPDAPASISINEPAPYAVGEFVTLTVEPGKLKGYEYPVVLEWCGFLPSGVKDWVYFRRWDADPGNIEAGAEPVLLTTAGTCTFELWAYAGLKGGPDPTEHVIAIGPTIIVAP